jgi:FixJ family two-component response regulator
MTELQKVVIVDDDAAMRTALGRLLTAGGYAPLSFASAEEFLAASPRDRPVCFVLDIHLGAMSGLDLQRLLKVGGSKVPVILMTAFDEPCLRDEAARNGCLAYLLKGSDADELLNLLRSLSS